MYMVVLRGFPVLLAGLAIVASALVAGPVTAQEHPEHPHDSAVPDDPVTLSQLADAITAYVEDDTELKGGYFLVYDDVNDEVLQLRLVQVHEERLSSLGDDTYFACADFATPDGTVYDIDVFMQARPRPSLCRPRSPCTNRTVSPATPGSRRTVSGRCRTSDRDLCEFQSINVEFPWNRIAPARIRAGWQPICTRKEQHHVF
jgi:hypothetical protein